MAAIRASTPSNSRGGQRNGTANKGKAMQDSVVYDNKIKLVRCMTLALAQ